MVRTWSRWVRREYGERPVAQRLKGAFGEKLGFVRYWKNLAPPPQERLCVIVWVVVLYLVVVGFIGKNLVGEIFDKIFFEKYFLKIFQNF